MCVLVCARARERVSIKMIMGLRVREPRRMKKVLGFEKSNQGEMKNERARASERL